MESNAASHTNHDRAAFSQSGLRPPRHRRRRLSTQYVTLITHPSHSGGAKPHSLRRRRTGGWRGKEPACHTSAHKPACYSRGHLSEHGGTRWKQCDAHHPHGVNAGEG